jgi:hypothetical protein
MCLPLLLLSPLHLLLLQLPPAEPVLAASTLSYRRGDLRASVMDATVAEARMAFSFDKGELSPLPPSCSYCCVLLL